MNIWRKIFRTKQKKALLQAYNFELSNEQGMAVEDFSNLNADNRIIQVVTLGDTGNLKYFDLLRFAIESDPDTGVRYAALKRIHLFKEHAALIPMLISMQENRAGEKLEPYFSMALSRVGIISIEDFKERINSLK